MIPHNGTITAPERWATITKRFTFESAHELPFHNGHCRNLHGHSYVLEVSALGPVGPLPTNEAIGASLCGATPELAPDTGMVLDFSGLSAVVKECVIAVLDHRYLNDIIPYPTAEAIIHWIWDQLAPFFDGQRADLTEIRLSETETGWVTINEGHR